MDIDKAIEMGLIDPTIFEELDTVSWRADQRTDEWLREHCPLSSSNNRKNELEYNYNFLSYKVKEVTIDISYM